MTKYLLEIQYKGTNYKGWQWQPELKTIQSTIEEKLKILLKEDITIFVAGRTDAGVHARQQFAHFETSQVLTSYKFLYNINAILKNETIAIKSIKVVDEDFHARYSCTSKTYKYYLLTGVRDVFRQDTYWLVPKFDIDKANECAKYLIGNHDFSSFKDAKCQSKSPIRTIDECFFVQKDEFIEFTIIAQSFLHHQIRIIMGTIYEIILKNEDPKKIKIILENKDRKTAGPTAPAWGLFMEEIRY